MELQQGRFLFLDGQTTGLSPHRCELIELGWCVSDAPNHIQSTLLRPSAIDAVPKKVWQMTGLTAQELQNAREPRPVWEPIAQLSGITAAIIHYAQFEIPFLKSLHENTFGKETPLPWPVICTYQLAQRLYPNLPARSLRALSGHFGTVLPETQRAHSHVAATQRIWQKLTEELKSQTGIASWEDFVLWWEAPHERPMPSAKSRRYLVERDKRLQLPNQPGIYEMLSTEGKILYVGKATSLHSRVNSYFRQRKKTRHRLKELMTQVADVRVTVTQTSLEAALLETDLIKTWEPPYNHSLRTGLRSLYFVSGCLSHFSSTRNEKHPWGPITSPHAFESLERLLLIYRGKEEAIPKVMLSHSPELTREKLKALLERSNGKSGDELTLRGLFDLARFTPLSVSQENRLSSPPKNETPLPNSDTPSESELAEASLYRKLRRTRTKIHHAHWLLWLTESRIFWEVPHLGFRVLEISQGRLAKAYCLAHPPVLKSFTRLRVPFRERQMKIDLTTYDRMRVLATEMELLSKRGTLVTVQFSSSRQYLSPFRYHGEELPTESLALEGQG